MEFEKMFRQRQIEMGLSNTELAELLGVHRSWVIARHDKRTKRRKLQIKTIGAIYNKMNIPIDLMEEYNESLGD